MISVILPVYNTEHYLKQCLDSVLCQTYRDFEVILIDDGSADGSGDICDEYAQKDRRVKVIHQKNRGVSSARNAGLREASGEWISFVDSDDWLEADMFQVLLTGAEKYQADIAAGDVYEESERGWTIRNIWKELGAESDDCFSGEKKFLYGLSYTPVLWNKLIKRTLMEQFFDEACTYGEDTLFLVEVVKKAQRVAVIKKPVYHYRFERVGNVVSERINCKTLHLLEAYQSVAEVMKEQGADEAAAHIIYIAVFQTLIKMHIGEIRRCRNYLKAVQAMASSEKRDFRVLKKNPRTSFFRRSLVAMAAISPECSVLVWNVRVFLKGRKQST